MADLIDRQMALDTIMGQPPEPHYPSWYAAQIKKLPAAQTATNCSEIPNGSDDTISRQAALKKLAVYIHLIDKTMGKGLLTDDDCMEAAKSVLGEDELPAAQTATNCSEIPNGSDDTISRRAAIDALTHEWDGMVTSVFDVIKSLPPAQPEQRWIPIKNRLPAVRCCRCLITRDDGRRRATVEEALFSFGRWYSNEWLEDGRNREFDISASVIAWTPFPAPYRGGEK